MGDAKNIKSLNDLQLNQEADCTCIYALVDPNTECVRYIGKSNNVHMRFRRHLKDARDGKSDHKSRWIAKLLRSGAPPVLTVLEVCDVNNWKERERYWIQVYRDGGVNLTNSKDGGDGYNPSIETKAKMSRAAMGRIPHNKGQKTTADIRSKQSVSAKRRWAAMSANERQSHIEAMQSAQTFESRSHSGWNHTDEAKRKISDSLKGNTRTLGYRVAPETRQKLSAALQGCLVTDETRRKIAQANRSLSVEKVEQIRKMLKDGALTQKKIADVIDTSESVISNIKLGKSYAV